MIVYVEDCFIQNFLVTFLILKCTGKFLKIETTKLRLIISCFFGGTISCLYPFFNSNGFIFAILKLVIGYLICAICYKDKNLSVYISFIIFTAVFGGLNILVYYLFYGTMNIQINFPTYILIGLLFAIYFIINQIFNYQKKKMTISNFVYKVTITNNEQTLLVNAFLDSGNTLLDIDNSPIFIINLKLFNKLYKDVTFLDLLSKNFKNLKLPHYVKSNFACGGGNILVFEVQCLMVETKEKNIKFKNAKLGLSYSKFAKNFNCDMLLNINAFT